MTGEGTAVRLRVLRRPLSLRTKLVLLLVVLPLLAAGPVLLVVPSRIDAQSREWVESRSLGVARLLASATSAAVEFDDAASATEHLRGLATVKDAAYALLLDDRGSVLASWGEASLPAGWSPRAEALTTSGGLAHVHVPVVTKTGRRASLVVGFALRELAQREAEVRALVTGAALFLLGLAAAVAVASSLFVVRPLRRVTAVARRIAQGDDTAHHDLERGRGDELGTLAQAFDVMLQRLYQQQAELGRREEAIRGLNVGLEARVEERTAALGRANEELQQSLAELKAAQEQLVVADRRVSIGRIAAGVAHEINNPLAYVSGNLAWLAETIAELQAALRAGGEGALAAVGERLAEIVPAVEEAQQGATRVHKIVKGLKTFSHGDEDVRTAVDPVAALNAAIDMAWHQIKHRARLEKDLRAVPRVDASEVRLTQVFLNLLVNAGQAIPEGASEQHRVGVAVRTDARGQVVVEVNDTGAGIRPEVRARLFEPFFTTKPAGVGNGLGLAISQGIVTSYGGTIEVESEPGRGSTFRVVLPPSTLAAAQPAAPAPAPETARLRVLVVDDEAAVGTVLVRQLSRFHDTVAVRSAREALDRVVAGEPFDRVVCDLEMPEMSGADFREELQRVAPRLAEGMLFMSGGAFSTSGMEIWQRERGRVIDKPVDLDRLRRALAGVPAAG